MKTLIVALLAGCCLAQPLIQSPITVNGQTWTAYTFSENPHPAVVRIAAPDIRFALPQYPIVSSNTPVVAAHHVPVVKPAVPVVSAYTAPVVAPVPIVKAAIAVAAAPSPVFVAAAPEPLQAPQPPMPSIGTPFVGGQFHAQDEAGQYSFGHWGGPNTRVETRDSLGRTSGSFAYIDPVGDVQVRKYAAGPASGFRVAASDLP